MSQYDEGVIVLELRLIAPEEEVDAVLAAVVGELIPVLLEGAGPPHLAPLDGQELAIPLLQIALTVLEEAAAALADEFGDEEDGWQGSDLQEQEPYEPPVVVTRDLEEMAASRVLERYRYRSGSDRTLHRAGDDVFTFFDEPERLAEDGVDIVALAAATQSGLRGRHIEALERANCLVEVSELLAAGLDVEELKRSLENRDEFDLFCRLFRKVSDATALNTVMRQINSGADA